MYSTMIETYWINSPVFETHCICFSAEWSTSHLFYSDIKHALQWNEAHCISSIVLKACCICSAVEWSMLHLFYSDWSMLHLLCNGMKHAAPRHTHSVCKWKMLTLPVTEYVESVPIKWMWTFMSMLITEINFLFIMQVFSSLRLSNQSIFL